MREPVQEFFLSTSVFLFSQKLGKITENSSKSMHWLSLKKKYQTAQLRYVSLCGKLRICIVSMHKCVIFKHSDRETASSFEIWNEYLPNLFHLHTTVLKSTKVQLLAPFHAYFFSFFTWRDVGFSKHTFNSSLNKAAVPASCVDFAHFNNDWWTKKTILGSFF